MMNAPSITPNDYNNEYVRIGYFQFDDNARSEYQAREMKTVHVDVLT